MPFHGQEKKMKKSIGKKLTLGKVTIKDLQANLDRDEQKAIRGGSVASPSGTTNLAVYCKP
jgi:hypothetical protein